MRRYETIVSAGRVSSHHSNRVMMCLAGLARNAQGEYGEGLGRCIKRPGLGRNVCRGRW